MFTRYTNYVQSCLRWYARNRNATKFRSTAQRKDYEACKEAFKRFSTSDQEMLLQIYYDGDTIPDNIYTQSIARGINQDIIWGMVNRLERCVARNRGLL